MDIGNKVRVVQAESEFYSTVSMNGADPFQLGRQGTVKAYAMNDQFEPGWSVKLAGVTDPIFFYEPELEQIDKVEGPVAEITGIVDKLKNLSRPSWCSNYEVLQSKLLRVDLGEEFIKIFGSWFKDEDHVRNKIEQLIRGEE